MTDTQQTEMDCGDAEVSLQSNRGRGSGQQLRVDDRASSVLSPNLASATSRSWEPGQATSPLQSSFSQLQSIS